MTQILKTQFVNNPSQTTQGSFKNYVDEVGTLEYLINVGVRLLIFWQFSTHYALIPYPTFINYGPITIKYGASNQKPLFMSLKKIILSKNLKKYLSFSLQRQVFIQKLIKQESTITVLLLKVKQIFKIFHPIRLFHPLRLSISKEISTQYYYSIPYVYQVLKSTFGKTKFFLLP